MRRKDGTIPVQTIRKHREGTRYFDQSVGYWKIKVGGKWIYEHRYVMEINLGRKLLKHEIVHHLNEDKQDNNLTNLEIVTRAEHNKAHFSISDVKLTCTFCFKVFNRLGTIFNKRKYRRPFCSRTCYFTFRVQTGFVNYKLTPNCP